MEECPLSDNLFGGYHLTHLNLNTVHEIDSPSGAFFLVRRSVTDLLGVFDEDYFMYGEDLDLSYRIKKSGYKVVYYPLHHVTHLKYSSGLKTKSKKVRTSTRVHFYDAMKVFYRKHYADKYPSLFNALIYKAVDIKKSVSR